MGSCRYFYIRTQRVNPCHAASIMQEPICLHISNWASCQQCHTSGLCCLWKSGWSERLCRTLAVLPARIPKTRFLWSQSGDDDNFLLINHTASRPFIYRNHEIYNGNLKQSDMMRSYFQKMVALFGRRSWRSSSLTSCLLEGNENTYLFLLLALD
jgi:hypothetical protein